MPSNQEFISSFNYGFLNHEHSYIINRHVGSGGHADVFEGYDHAAEKPAALKIFQLSDNPNDAAVQLRNFRREANWLKSLNHPNIVDVTWHGIHEYEQRSYPYLVMEYVNGGTLNERRKHRFGRLPAEEAISLMAQVMLGMQHVNTRFTHRDLKPDNVLIATDQEVVQIDGFPNMRPYGVAKIADLGAATIGHINQHTVTAHQDVIGTIAYMAPEHFEGRAVAASDVYSLAVMFYEQLSGERPVGNDRLNTAQWYGAHVYQAPRPLEEAMGSHMNELTAAIHDHIMKGLAKKVEDRYLTMGDFYEDFAQSVRKAVARMQRHGVTVDLGVNAGDVTKALGEETNAVPDLAQPHQTHFIRKEAGAPPKDELKITPEVTDKPLRLSRRSLLVGAAGLATLGIGGATWNFLANQGIEEDKKAIAGIAKEIVSELHKDNNLKEMFKLMSYLIPYDAQFVAEQLSNFRAYPAVDANWPVVGKLSFHLPEAADREIRSWGSIGYVTDTARAATALAAIADIPDHPYAEKAASVRDYVINTLGGQGFWTSYYMMYAVGENKSVTNPVTGQPTTGEEIWQSIVKDPGHNELNAISTATNSHNSDLLTRYAETYMQWLDAHDPDGLKFGVIRNAYTALAPFNPQAVKSQLERLAASTSGAADELAQALAVELAPYDPNAAVQYVNDHRHLEYASSLAAISLTGARPNVAQEVADATKNETLKWWINAALDPTDGDVAKVAVARLKENRDHLKEHGPSLAGALLLSRMKS